MKKEIKIQIKSIFGNVLFEYSCIDNTIKKTVEKAVKENADLRNADLRNADLRNADLRNANLENADLRNADLRNADLYNANLENADLRNADLRNADLYNANLGNADLRNANLENADLRNADLGNTKNKDASCLPIYCKWSFSIKGNLIKIGCKEKTIKEWDGFFNSGEVYDTPRDSEEFKRIQAVYEGLKAYMQFLEK